MPTMTDYEQEAIDEAQSFLMEIGAGMASYNEELIRDTIKALRRRDAILAKKVKRQTMKEIYNKLKQSESK